MFYRYLLSVLKYNILAQMIIFNNFFNITLMLNVLQILLKVTVTWFTHQHDF